MSLSKDEMREIAERYISHAKPDELDSLSESIKNRQIEYEYNHNPEHYATEERKILHIHSYYSTIRHDKDVNDITCIYHKPNITIHFKKARELKHIQIKHSFYTSDHWDIYPSTSKDLYVEIVEHSGKSRLTYRSLLVDG